MLGTKIVVAAILLSLLLCGATIFAEEKKSSEQDFIKFAENFERSQNYSKALDQYQLAYGVPSLKSGAVAGIARVFSATGRFDEAVNLLVKEIEQDNPYNSLWHATLSELYGERQNFELSEKHLLLAEKLNTKSPRVAYARGKFLYFKQDFKAAHKIFNVLISQGIDIFDLHMLRAKSAFAQKLHKESIRDLNWLISRFPDYFEAKVFLAKVYFADGGLNRAQTLIEQFILQFPADSTWRQLLANIYAEQKKYARAIDTLKQSIELDHDNVDLYLQLVSLQIKNNEKENAIKTLELTIKLFPSSGDVQKQIADLIADTAEIEHVANFLRKIYLAHPEYHWAAIRLAKIHFSFGDVAFAKKLIQTELNEKNSSLDVLLFASRIEAAINNYENSEEYLKKAEELYPESPHVQYNRGILYQKQKLYSKAESEFEKITAIDTAISIKAAVNLSHLYVFRGELSQAQSVIERVGSYRAITEGEFKYYKQYRKYIRDLVQKFAQTRSTASTEVPLEKKIYIVSPGDTISTISQKVYGTAKKWKKLLADNPTMGAPESLVQGTRLVYFSNGTSTSPQPQADATPGNPVIEASLVSMHNAPLNPFSEMEEL